MNMTISDYIELFELGLTIIGLITVFVLSHIHFKNKKWQERAEYTTRLINEWVGYQDKQNISNPEKLSGAINHVAGDLKRRGFNVTDQDLKEIEAGVETAVTALRIKQAQLNKPADKPTQPPIPAQSEKTKPDVVTQK